MPTDELIKDLHDLLTKHNHPAAMLVIPQDATQEFFIITREISTEHLRLLGHMLIKHLPDTRGALN